MISLVIVGTGRMGSIVRSLAEAERGRDGSPVFEVVRQVGFDLSELGDAPAADVVIDFSNASTADAVFAYVRRTGAALVSGTTGYDDEHLAALRSLGSAAPVLHSGNYSLGVAVLKHLAAQAARELEGFDIEIVECHHNQKVDAPSGTAKLLFDAVSAAREEACGEALREVDGRSGQTGARDPREVGVHALRGGTVAGVHTVSLLGPSEEVSLTHRAESREIFARGAIAATRRLVGRPAGVYTFDEVMFG